MINMKKKERTEGNRKIGKHAKSRKSQQGAGEYYWLAVGE